ncbi:hypothetical protein PR048_032259 [Dryococelus australis]|uniref:Uncharacterized protein n=1 Tax=Dryococelus australis TaxID=614101 RepID=A0ABQ9G5V0_9NEOP|nr:hypothetical protein PR048_032259 [Dryococelus australis]
MQGLGKREIPEKTRRPVSSSGMIPICENPGVTRPGIEPGLHCMKQRWIVRAGGTGDTRENPPISGIVRHYSHMRKSGSDPVGNQIRFASVGVKWSNHYITVASSKDGVDGASARGYHEVRSSPSRALVKPGCASLQLSSRLALKMLSLAVRVLRRRKFSNCQLRCRSEVKRFWSAREPAREKREIPEKTPADRRHRPARFPSYAVELSP